VRGVAEQRGIKAPNWPTTLEAMEGTDRLVEIEELGDLVALLVERGKVTATRGEALLVELAECMRDPIGTVGRVAVVTRELKELLR
jgi:hypothetical protein